MKKDKLSKFFYILAALIILSGGFFQVTADAGIIYESATMGNSEIYTAFLLFHDQFLGTRFHITEKVQVTSIGGHLQGPGPLFGAIISLSSATDLPKGSPLNSSEILASTVFNVPIPDCDFRTPLSVLLEPGYYGLIFGSDLFGATNGYGDMPFGGKITAPEVSYFIWGTPLFSSDGSWSQLPSSVALRFVVEGTVVPEPAMLLLFGLGGLFIRRKNQA
jgi:hypothetical protein